MVITYEEELNLVKGILVAADFSEEDAALIAKVISHSDFTGVYSHGLSRLTRYMRQIKAGSLNPRPNFRKVLDTGAVMVFDGDNGSGIASLCKAYDETLERARQFGIAMSTGRHNANIGCGSYYGWRAAQEDMVAIVCCNTYAFTSPFGGADRLIGTNPIVVGVPAGQAYPMVLDMSTTNVAMGKIQAAEREGQAIPAEWAKDYDGNPTTDPSKAFSLSPIANHKGYGLAVMVDVLSTMFSGACFGTDIGLFSKLEKENTGFCLILLDPSKFMPLDEFKAEVDRYAAMMKESRKAPGVKEIFLPGEIEYRKMETMKQTGFEVSEKLAAELAELSVQLGEVPEGTDFAALVQHFNA
ncbi:MAG: Ldh family oxidoreductase [Oscillospiraceae bacterium]|nr:Ldh family oxidoreductase [Oscillospiraceae bacterium]